MIREDIAMRLHARERTVVRITCEKSPLNVSWDDLSEAWKEQFREGADQILSLITTEIEKVENPHDADVLGNGRLTGDLPFALYNGFEDCRQSILNLLKEKA